MFSSPEKCIPSVTKLSLLLHFIGSVWYIGGVYYDRNYAYMPAFDAFGGRFQFLTMINLYVTFAASVFAFCADLIQITTGWLQPNVGITKDGYAKNLSVVIRIRDELISFWVYMGSTLVPILYWGLVVIDKEGIHNDKVEKYLPLFGLWNQLLHTIPMVYGFLLVTLVNYEYICKRRMLFNCTTFTTGYVSWMGYCAKHNGHWPYPVLDQQTTVEFIVFIGVCIVVMMVMQLLGRKWSSLVWSQRRRENVIIQSQGNVKLNHVDNELAATRRKDE